VARRRPVERGKGAHSPVTAKRSEGGR
jgi:hypothetical protein